MTMNWEHLFAAENDMEMAAVHRQSFTLALQAEAMEIFRCSEKLISCVHG